MPNNSVSAGSGTLASVTSTTLFATIFYITPQLAPLTGMQVWSLRVFATVPFLTLIMLSMKQQHTFLQVWQRIREKPVLLLGIAVSGALIGVQLWLFSWAPLNDRGLPMAMGYFLFPLVLVIIGRFVYKDQLKWWHWLATGVAALGVIFELVRVGSISWETVMVCLGYPLYFMLRRALQLGSTGGMLWEFLCMFPFASWLLIRTVGYGPEFAVNTQLWWLAPLFGFLASLALWLYVLSSKLLPISIFGLLTYVEPALLVVASLLLGERLVGTEVITYLAIWCAVLILLGGGIRDVLRSRR